jgi:hypothetical protein
MQPVRCASRLRQLACGKRKLIIIFPLSSQLVDGLYVGRVRGVGDALSQAPPVGQAHATTEFGPYGMNSDPLRYC